MHYILMSKSLKLVIELRAYYVCVCQGISVSWRNCLYLVTSYACFFISLSLMEELPVFIHQLRIILFSLCLTESNERATCIYSPVTPLSLSH